MGVLKSMRFMHRFLLEDNCAALHSIGDDAACVFFEIWYNSADSLIRADAKGVAVDLLKRYEGHIIQKKPNAQNEIRDVFFELMYLLRCYAELDAALDAEPLLVLADE